MMHTFYYELQLADTDCSMYRTFISDQDEQYENARWIPLIGTSMYKTQFMYIVMCTERSMLIFLLFSSPTLLN